MSGENWTPGPWFHDKGLIHNSDGDDVGVTPDWCNEDRDLALASPEMYAANKYAETVIEMWLDAVHDQAREQLLDALESLHNAGAKARGEDT